MWSLGINSSILMLWLLAINMAHDSLHRLHGRWFRISVEQFDTVHNGSMATYKIVILLLNLVPYLSLRMVA